MYRDLTKGNITKGLLLFALPMIAGNLLQQFYNIADTLIVGQALGQKRAGGGGLCVYAHDVSHIHFPRPFDGRRRAVFDLPWEKGLCLASKRGLSCAHFDFRSDGGAQYPGLCVFRPDPALSANPGGAVRFDAGVPCDHFRGGLSATFLYNFFACLLRAVGNSVAPLWFLGAAALLNVGLDLLFVLVFSWGIAGAAIATVLAQYVSGIGILIYAILKCREFLPGKDDRTFSRAMLAEILDLSLLTCAQQSAMNFGILLIQRLVDSFGAVTMAAFAAAVKIDSFAYLPVQDFGNAFSTFTAQNYGAGKKERLKQGFRQATIASAAFSVVISALVCIFANPLMCIFVQAGETEVLAGGRFVPAR